MAEVSVPLARFREGQLPSVCKSGKPTQVYATIELVDVPKWSYLLIFFGLIPYLLVRQSVGKLLKVRLPLTKPRKILRVVVPSVAFAVGLIAVFTSMGAAIANNPALAYGSLIVVAVLLVAAVTVWVWLSVGASFADESVVLARVHPNFKAAMEDPTTR